MESYSLYQVNEYIRRVIALNFREPIWIEAEISQCKESKGNYYIDLIDKDEGTLQINANAQANLWLSNFRFIKRKIGKVIHELLQDGRQVRLKCRVDFNERYGLKLVVEDIDPNFTFGKLELSRQQTIERLKSERLFNKNKAIDLPTIIQRIALISSPNAAGYKDFIAQVNTNIYGYQLHITLFESSVQGNNVDNDTCRAIDQIKDAHQNFDAVIILRGGGSKLDLSAFDSYEISKKIALSDLPFIIGIGHEIDQSVVDTVSRLSLKTPTAVADYLIEHMLNYEANALSKLQRIKNIGDQLLFKSLKDLELSEQQLSFSIDSQIGHQHQKLELTALKIEHLAATTLSEEQARIHNIDQVINSNDPKLILNKGYSFISKEGKHVSTSDQVKKGDIVTLSLQDGNLTSEIL